MLPVNTVGGTVDHKIQTKFDSYPQEARNQLLSVRELILAIAADNGLGSVAETLKWGEASYSVKGAVPFA
jgi:hypothetical protein